MTPTRHLVPAEDWAHEYDHRGDCICGPAVRAAGPRLLLQHWPLDARWYAEPPRAKEER